MSPGISLTIAVILYLLACAFFREEQAPQETPPRTPQLSPQSTTWNAQDTDNQAR